MVSSFTNDWFCLNFILIVIFVWHRCFYLRKNYWTARSLRSQFLRTVHQSKFCNAHFEFLSRLKLLHSLPGNRPRGNPWVIYSQNRICDAGLEMMAVRRLGTGAVYFYYWLRPYPQMLTKLPRIGSAQSQLSVFSYGHTEGQRGYLLSAANYARPVCILKPMMQRDWSVPFTY